MKAETQTGGPFGPGAGQRGELVDAALSQVGQAVLQMRPHPLGRVEGGCGGGEAEHGQSVAGRDELAHRGVDVMGVRVPHRSAPRDRRAAGGPAPAMCARCTAAVYRPRVSRIVAVGGTSAAHPAQRPGLVRAGRRRDSRKATMNRGVAVQDAHQQAVTSATVRGCASAAIWARPPKRRAMGIRATAKAVAHVNAFSTAGVSVALSVLWAGVVSCMRTANRPLRRLACAGILSAGRSSYSRCHGLSGALRANLHLMPGVAGDEAGPVELALVYCAPGCAVQSRGRVPIPRAGCSGRGCRYLGRLQVPRLARPEL